MKAEGARSKNLMASGFCTYVPLTRPPISPTCPKQLPRHLLSKPLVKTLRHLPEISAQNPHGATELPRPSNAVPCLACSWFVVGVLDVESSMDLEAKSAAYALSRRRQNPSQLQEAGSKIKQGSGT